MKYLGYGLIGLIAAAIAAYFFADQPDLDLTPETRAELQSAGLADSFVALSDGVAHYRSAGADDAPVIILVHGFSIPSLAYDSYFAPLAEAGYRIVAVDLYGRGFSDRPDLPMDEELMVRQLEELTDALDISRPFHLAGASMGGAVVTDFAARNSDDINSLILITPVGLSEEVGPPGILKVPVVGEWISRVVGSKLLAKRFLPYISDAPNADRMRRLYEAQFEYRGFSEAILSASRNFSFAPREKEHKKLAASDVSIISIWGDVDETVPIEGKDILSDWNPQAQIFVLENGGHHITYARSTEIIEIVLGSLE